MDVVFLGVNDVGGRVYKWLCDRRGVEVVALLTERAQLDLIRSVEPDMVVSVGFDHLVPEAILKIPPQGCVNVHPSYLPYNRGKSPNVWSIIDGTPAGVTIHFMDENFDTGDIIARKQVNTDFSDSGKDLHERLAGEQYRLFTETWPKLEAGKVDTIQQEIEEGTYHSVDEFKQLCEIDSEETVETKEFLDRLRALTFPPFDNALINVGGKEYYVDVDIRSAEETSDETPEGRLDSY